MKPLLLLVVLALSSSAEAFLGLFGGRKEYCDGRCMVRPNCWMASGIVDDNRSCLGWLDVCCVRNRTSVRQKQKVLERMYEEEDEERDADDYRAYHWINVNELPSEKTKDEKFKKIEFGPVFNEPGCGRIKIAKRRVVGGGNAGFGQFPWQALVYANNDRCGGALINRRHVVTAGHCVVNQRDLLPARFVSVVLGEYTIGSNSEPLGEVEYRVERIALHPRYGWREHADRFDIAVLRLKDPVDFQPHIQPICLPAAGQHVPEGTKAAVAGWGATVPRTTWRPRTLQSVDLEVVDSRKCEKWHYFYAWIKMRINREMMCAGFLNGGRDACQGDSGGPLVANLKLSHIVNSNSTSMNSTGAQEVTVEEQRYTLIGLVSAGFSCARPGRPGIYHRISETADWISYASRMSNMGIDDSFKLNVEFVLKK